MTLRRHLRDTIVFLILLAAIGSIIKTKQQTTINCIYIQNTFDIILYKFDVHSPLVLSLNDDYISSDFPTHSDTLLTYDFVKL